jgi:type II secretory ATPase GspE/PulE/Tfp pilus assembly ATPase PilB-like protein
VNDEMADLIARAAPPHEIRARARARGMRTLFDDAVAKVRAGITTLDELRRHVPYRMVAEALEPDKSL